MNKNSSGTFLVGSIITIAVLFGLVLLILARMDAIQKNVVAPESMEPEAVEERIAPVAEVNVGEPPAAPAAPAEPAAQETQVAAEGGVGEKIVNQVCAMCHASGLMNSPRIGNAEDWAPRLEQGIETVYDHAINGLNMMPARGGNPSLTDDEVKAAVDFMIAGTQ